ncbi:hypothetical protein LR48_Vigan549s006300 [Vigna angularis]|uniref:Uncharacterized protein n=1 Tax=Phaseolus angularis TaxID=3914 RepID=A0A0L9TDB5_PHAAN|nr:hypothetical protein LR48_Vigan549s006300 [Vigna angularis]
MNEVLVHKVNLDGTDQPRVGAVEGISVTTSPECTNVVATQDSYSPDSQSQVVVNCMP